MLKARAYNSKVVYNQSRCELDLIQGRLGPYETFLYLSPRRFRQPRFRFLFCQSFLMAALRHHRLALVATLALLCITNVVEADCPDETICLVPGQVRSNLYVGPWSFPPPFKYLQVNMSAYPEAKGFSLMVSRDTTRALLEVAWSTTDRKPWPWGEGQAKKSMKLLQQNNIIEFRPPFDGTRTFFSLFPLKTLTSEALTSQINSGRYVLLRPHTLGSQSDCHRQRFRQFLALVDHLQWLSNNAAH